MGPIVGLVVVPINKVCTIFEELKLLICFKNFALLYNTSEIIKVNKTEAII